MRAEEQKSALEPQKDNPYLAFKAKLWVLAVSIGRNLTALYLGHYNIYIHRMSLRWNFPPMALL